MLLLAQNEIGQIAGRSLTKPENNEETEVFLKSIVFSDVSPPTGTRYLAIDNANAVRKMAHRVVDHSFVVKQEPFHVIQPISEK